jgi:hypothetical protein
VAIRACQVSFADSRGITHSVRVHAESVLEAAALGVRTVRETGVLEDEGTFDVIVEIQTTTRHKVPWPRLKAWLESSSRNPKERLMKR